MSGSDVAPGALRVEHGDGQTAFLEQLGVLLDACGDLSDDDLQAASHCRGWTVGDVLVHVHLELPEMLLGLVSPSMAPPDTDAAGYWRSELPTNDPDADRIAQMRFVRLVGAAYRRPTGLVAHLRPTADGIATAVAALADGAVRFQGHVMSTGDFLATWAVELAVHHLDLGRELDLPPPAPSAALLARATIDAIAGSRLPEAWPDRTAILIGTGRLRMDDDQAREAGELAGRLPALG